MNLPKSNCVICGCDLPLDMTQIVISFHGQPFGACCLIHMGTLEYYQYTVKCEMHAEKNKETLDKICDECKRSKLEN